MVYNQLELDILVSLALSLVANLAKIVFLKFLFTTLLSLLKSAGTVLSLPTTKFYTLVLKLSKSVPDASVDVSMSIAPYRLAFVV